MRLLDPDGREVHEPHGAHTLSDNTAQATAITATALTARSAAAIWLGNASQTATIAATHSKIKAARAIGNFRPSLLFCDTSKLLAREGQINLS
jgi:hypothetical protein